MPIFMLHLSPVYLNKIPDFIDVNYIVFFLLRSGFCDTIFKNFSDNSIIMVDRGHQLYCSITYSVCWLRARQKQYAVTV